MKKTMYVVLAIILIICAYPYMKNLSAKEKSEAIMQNTIPVEYNDMEISSKLVPTVSVVNTETIENTSSIETPVFSRITTADSYKCSDETIVDNNDETNIETIAEIKDEIEVIAVITDVEEQKDEQTDEEVSEESNVVEQPFNYVSAIVASSDVSDTMLRSVTTNYMKIPENVRSVFEANGGTVLIKNNIINDFKKNNYAPGISQIRAFCHCESDGQSTIYIDNRESCDESVTHEMGHFIDYYSKNDPDCNGVTYAYSASSEFINIWNAELSKFKKHVINRSKGNHPNNYNTVDEYFASAYSCALLDTDVMKEFCPMTYEYVMRISNKY